MSFRNCYFSLIILLLSLWHFQPSNAFKGGYFQPDGGLSASDIDSTLFTHLFCTFAPFDAQTGQVTLPPECSNFPSTVKQKNSDVQALLSIGGGGVESSKFNTIAGNPSSRKTFIDSSINVAVANGFNGLDLDWEQQQSQDEMDNLAELLKEWRAAIKAQSEKEPLLLTAALRYKSTSDSGTVQFPVQAIVDNLDWVNVMAYDFYGAKWPPQPLVTKPHASLHDPSSDVSGSSGINSWTSAGVPSNKLMLGLPFYGYAWILSNANVNGILAPSSGGDTTSLGDEYGTISYDNIKNFISRTGATVKYNSTYVANYCYSGTSWIGYDDVDSIKHKVKYAKDEASLLGYFVWNIQQDTDQILSKQASETWGA